MSETQSILVIDDEDSICLAFEQFFSRRRWTVHTAATAQLGLDLCRREQPHVVFLDVRLPDRSGLELLEELCACGAGVIVITAYGGLDTVVRAIQGKAFDYLVKPLDLDKAYSLAQRVLEARRKPAAAPAPTTAQDQIVGNSPAMQEVYKLIARAAASESPVLIQGETGTGKELVARAIHRYSPRAASPFVAVNCGAMPESLVESELFGHVRGAFTGADADRQGRFQSADGGTLLLDEVGDLPAATQVKLLRVLEDGMVAPVGSSRSLRVNVRVLAATNRNLAEEMDRGRFRRDLYYRLGVLHICLPPLRERRDDIVPLACHFLGRAAGEAAIHATAREALLRHDWPGNVRELRNAIGHAQAVAPDRTVQPEDLPRELIHHAEGSSQASLLIAAVEQVRSLGEGVPNRLDQVVREVETAVIRDAMERFGNNQSQAAEYLGIHRNTLREKLRDLAGEAPQV